MPSYAFNYYTTVNALNAGDFVVAYLEDDLPPDFYPPAFITKVEKAVIAPYKFIIGYVTQAYGPGSYAKVYSLGGVNYAQSGLVPGDSYYSHPTIPGAVTNVMPVGTEVVQRLGIALSSIHLDTMYNGIMDGTGGGGGPSGPAGGDLTGTYPNPGVNWGLGSPVYDLLYYPLAANPAGYLTSITALDVTTALGYTPYNSTNPSGYITSAALAPYITAATAAATYYPLTNPSGYISGITALMISAALGYTPYDASNPAGYITSAALTGYLTAATAAATYTPLTRNITINGTTQDLSADRTWSVGTVTSVGGTGTVSGLTLTGTVTGSGNLTLGGTLSLTSGDVTTALGFTPLSPSNNLSEVTNDATARINLGIQDIYLTGNQTTTSNVAVNITELVWSGLANTRYKFMGIIATGCSGTGGVKLQVTIPAGATMKVVFFGITNTSTAFTSTNTTASATLTASSFTTFNSTNGWVWVMGEIQTGATAGNLQFGFASGTNTQTSTIYKLGTHLTVTTI